MRILLSGEPGIGKSTILEKILAQCEQQKKKVNGCIVKEIQNNGLRSGFKIHYLPSHEEMQFASCEAQLSHEYISKFSVSMDVIETELIPFMNKMALDQKSDIFIFDEIGRMQNLSPLFLPAVDSLLCIKQPLIATIVHDDEIWARKYKEHSDFISIVVTKQNRDAIPSIIQEMMYNSIA